MKDMIMKKIIWLSLALAFGITLVARGDDDGTFIGRSVDLVERNRMDYPLIKAPAPAPRPVVAAASAQSHSGNVRLLKQMPAELTLGQEFAYQLQVIANENVADVVVRDVVPEGATSAGTLARVIAILLAANLLGIPIVGRIWKRTSSRLWA